jgi:uncharacterized protein (TIGR02453 family)
MPANDNLKPALQFLDELSANNHKPWFDAHRAEYQAARKAFEGLVGELIDEFRFSDHLQALTPKDCMARIYRDVRFSKDKSPYKTNLGAMIAPGGWGNTMLGYYVSIQPHGQSLLGGGLYMPTPEQLYYFRQAIDRDAAKFKRLISAQEFIAAFRGVSGERLKTAPKGYDRSHPEIELLQFKQVTVIRRFSDEEVLADDFSGQVVSLCHAMRPFLDYLSVVTQG